MSNKKDNARMHLHTELNKMAQCLFPDDCPIPFSAVCNCIGLMMAVYAVMMMLKAPYADTVAIYAIVASEFNRTIDAVVNSIRYMITMLWDKNRDAFCAYAGTNLDKQPTVSEFLALLLAKMREYQKLHPEESTENVEAVGSTDTAETTDTAKPEETARNAEAMEGAENAKFTENTEAAQAAKNEADKLAVQEQTQKDNAAAVQENRDEDRKKLHQEIYEKAKCLFPDDSPIPFAAASKCKGFKMAVYATMLKQKAPEENAAKPYAIVASEFNCTVNAVVCSIRYMITVLWNKDCEAFCAYAGSDLKLEPTVTEFLALLLVKMHEYQKQHPEEYAEDAAAKQAVQESRGEGRMKLHQEIYEKAKCLFPDDSLIPFSQVWNYQGFKVAVYAAMLMQKAPYENTVKIYAIVASEFKCTISGVVNRIRYMITRFWKKDRKAFCAFIGTDLDKQPTVSEFLELLLAKLRQDQKQHPEAFGEDAKTAEAMEGAESAESTENTVAAEAAENVVAKQTTKEQPQNANAAVIQENKDEWHKKLHQEILEKAKCMLPEDSPILFGKVRKCKGLVMAVYATMLKQKAPDENAAKIYAAVASEFGCTISGVVKRIRYMITVLWNKDREAFCAYAGADLDKQPTVSQFLALLLAKMRECQKQHPEAFEETAETTGSVEGVESASTVETAEDVDAKAVREQS